MSSDQSLKYSRTCRLITCFVDSRGEQQTLLKLTRWPQQRSTR